MSIRILENLAIPEDEVGFETARAGGPGGQHVNKTESSVTVVFDVNASATLDERQKALILEKLATRISKEGVLRVTARRESSQHRNRALAVARFSELLAEALTPKKARRPTRPTRGSQRRRIEDKKQRGDVKRGRSKRYRPED